MGADPSLTPELIEAQAFTSGFRGYEPTEVRDFLVRVAAEVRALRDRADQLESAWHSAEERAARPPVLDEDTLMAAVGEETATILRAARSAAADLRPTGRVRMPSGSSPKPRRSGPQIRAEAEGVLAREDRRGRGSRGPLVESGEVRGGRHGRQGPARRRTPSGPRPNRTRPSPSTGPSPPASGSSRISPGAGGWPRCRSSSCGPDGSDCSSPTRWSVAPSKRSTTSSTGPTPRPGPPPTTVGRRMQRAAGSPARPTESVEAADHGDSSRGRPSRRTTSPRPADRRPPRTRRGRMPPAEAGTGPAAPGAPTHAGAVTRARRQRRESGRAVDAASRQRAEAAGGPATGGPPPRRPTRPAASRPCRTCGWCPTHEGAGSGPAWPSPVAGSGVADGVAERGSRQQGGHAVRPHPGGHPSTEADAEATTADAEESRPGRTATKPCCSAARPRSSISSRPLTRKLKRALQDEQNDLLDRLRSLAASPRSARLLPELDDQMARYASAAQPLVDGAAAAGVAFAVEILDRKGSAPMPAPRRSPTWPPRPPATIVDSLRRRLEHAISASAGDEQSRAGRGASGRPTGSGRASASSASRATSWPPPSPGAPGTRRRTVPRCGGSSRTPTARARTATTTPWPAACPRASPSRPASRTRPPTAGAAACWCRTPGDRPGGGDPFPAPPTAA